MAVLDPARPTGAEDGWTALAVAEAAGPPGEVADAPKSRLGQTGAHTLAGLGAALADPRLVLPWLLAGLGAPLTMVGLLVPVQGALTLLGQILAARRLPVRSKWAWVGGSTLAGVALILMALAAMVLGGAAAHWAILLCLAAGGLGQGIAAVAGRAFGAASLGGDRSGAVLAQAGTLACVGAGAFALYLGFLGEGEPGGFLGLVLAIAGVLLIYAASAIARLPKPVAVPASPPARAGGDPAIARLLAVRACFALPLLAVPFVAVLVQQGADGGLRALGQLVLAAAFAAGLAPSAWSGLAGASSRRLLVAAGGFAALATAGIGLLVLAMPEGLGLPLVAPVAIFLVVLAAAGMRLGLGLAFVERAGTSGTAMLGDGVVALVLLLGGLGGLLAEAVGIGVVLLLLAAVSGIGVGLAHGLPEMRRGG